ncbi:CocE/NonD family hydrolase [Nocardioides sp. L-11A]|uniref:CocE/NonD family hydrolase n=1 Tax=Nocardioides sp. L-11A TaxID=3043848 RepID=UPI00249C6597|nr:CocE/NonD family hydrolase [Nocardioides sp. L-11A]
MRTEITGDVAVERDHEVAVRDGVVLRADVYRATGGEDAPVLLQRTPYDKSVFTELGVHYARAGYTAIFQDVRGQFASDGVWQPFENEAADGFDTVAWAAALPGTTGRVGMIGTSYQASCAWQAARLRPPALAALACGVTPVDYYTDWVYPGGAFALAMNTTWLLRNVASSASARLPDGAALQAGMTAAYDDLIDRWWRYLPLDELPPLLPDRPEVAGYFFDWIDHPTRDEYWERISLRGVHADIDIPVLNVAGWYDVFVNAGIEAFGALPDGRKRLVVGPWDHNTWGKEPGEVDFGPSAMFSFPGAVVAWMDRWLKGHRPATEPAPVRYFRMGDLTWQEAPTWPPPGTTELRLLLDGGGRLVEGGAPTGADSYVYDPSDPVPSIGGRSCCYPPSPIGPRDQRALAGRPDVLGYATDPLDHPLELAGPVRVELYASSTAPDTDFTAKLVDVHPDGTAINVCEGIIRARLREGFDREVLLTPGETVRLDIDLAATAIVFGPGHRVRLEISSSNFPTFDRNPNTGAPFGRDARMVTARQHIHHDAAHPSALVLTAVPRTDG